MKDSTDTRFPDRVIGLSEKLGYAAGDSASVLYFKVFSSFLVFFYTDVIAVAPAAIGTMLIVTRVFDALNDPVMGMIADRTRSPHGRFRPWLRWMLIPFAVSGVLVFMVPDWNDSARLVYIYVSYTFAMLCYTAINIPYGALMGVMTPHSHERTVLASFRFYGAYLANLAVQGTLLILVVDLGGSRDGQTPTQAGYVRTMLVYAALATGLFLFTFYSTKERVAPPARQARSLWQDVAQLLKTRPWLAIVGVGVTTILWMAMRDAAVLYYIKYYVVADTADGARFARLATWFNVVGTATTLLGVAASDGLARCFGSKRRAYMALTLAVSLVGSGYYFVAPGDIVLLFGLQALSSFLMGPLMPLFWSMIADTADYSEWKYGRRFTGLVFSAGTFSQKVGWAAGPAFAAYLLAYFGFVNNQPQSETTVQGLRWMMSLFPSALGLFAAALVLTYGIDRDLERQVERELTARKQAQGTLRL